MNLKICFVRDFPAKQAYCASLPKPARLVRNPAFTLDCVAALAPGILTTKQKDGTVYLAVDEGVLVKPARMFSCLCVSHRWKDLATHEAVKRSF